MLTCLRSDRIIVITKNMDEFAKLRQKLYLSRNPGDWDDAYRRLKALGAAILGDAVTPELSRQVVLAAAMRLPGADAGRLSGVDWDGESPYVARYLADAGARPEPAAVPPSVTVSGPAVVNHPVSVVQCMFHGDPMRSGRGSSGGIATLLLELGNAMGESVGGVVTLVLYNTAAADYPFVPVEQVTGHHSIVRAPGNLDDETPMGFLRGHRRIRDALRSTLAGHGIRPGIVHVRFLDDASLAAARLAGEWDARLVTTVTPDPHRTLCGPEGTLQKFSADRALEIFNKVVIGDELIRLSDGLLAIGRPALGRELLPYFPQLEDTRHRVIDGIDEGVRIRFENPGIDIPKLLTGGPGPFRLNRSALKRPVILCVGRLAPVKQPTSLVRAWSQGPWETHNLVLVGGDHENPDATESGIIDEVHDILSSRPELAHRVCFLPAQPNAVVRSLQAYFSGRTLERGFDAYVCPSVKEEFGLSIIEAMSGGMMVGAPIRGGARTYISHGINGFLVDTSDPGAMLLELYGTVLHSGMRPEQVDAIRRNAARTAAERYALETIAGKFAAFYRKVENA